LRAWSSKGFPGAREQHSASRPCIALLHAFLSNTNSLTHSYILRVNTPQLPKAEKIYLSFWIFSALQA
jgi:hypothetical protein